MNAVIECLETRRSVRAYKPDMPSQEIIDQVIEAGIYAPTGKGHQSPVIVAVTNKAVRDRLSRMNAEILGMVTDPSRGKDPFYGAPVVLVVLADRSWPTHVYDGSLVMGNLMNAAHSLGLGSCWIHRAKDEFDSPEGKELLKEWGIEGDYEGIGHCILGYPLSNANPAPKTRKPDYVKYVK
ncbi:MAG: nitroreductase [Bacteroidales bacterium]|jgi:nitroreductase|nr:nitroreductase [Bacteroidales bacterium]MCI1786406.1 nitroreductase [Bacteroidales bacterium]